MNIGYLQNSDSDKLRKFLFVFLFILSLSNYCSSSLALASGIIFSFSIGNPFKELSGLWSKQLLKISVVGLGFGVGIEKVISDGRQSLVSTIVVILIILIVGNLLGKALQIRQTITWLISFGTAICGGSAIAALSPVIKAKQEDVAVALATVFTLNAIALFVFPLVGHYFGMSQESFGLWAAVAIHDTSSVVGAATSYGPIALETSVVVKLTRALWIIPIVFAVALVNKSEKKTKLPLFILGFVVAVSMKSFIPAYLETWDLIAALSKHLLVATLFLIGSGLGREILKKVGVLPLVHATVLWLLVSSVTLAAILTGILSV